MSLNQKVNEYCEFNQTNLLGESNLKLLDEMFASNEISVCADENNEILMEDNQVRIFLDDEITEHMESHELKNVCKFAGSQLLDYFKNRDCELIMKTAEQELIVEKDVLCNYFQYVA